jgi:hypothetical protein
MLPEDDILPALDSFIQRDIGTIVQVFHEVKSPDHLHIDVYHARSADASLACQWLITAGMSREPMTPAPERANERYTELAVCLPARWPLEGKAYAEPENYWPIARLRELARYPFRNRTWLACGHTVSNEKPLGPNTKMTAVVLMRPRLMGENPVVSVRDRQIPLLAVCPIYEDERLYVKRRGHEALARRLARRGITELIHPQRKSLVNYGDSRPEVAVED